MPTTAKTLVDKVVKQREEQQRNKRAPAPHPDAISLLAIDAQLALARSNVELAEALQAFAGAADKQNGALKDAVVELTAKVAALGKR